MSCVRPLVRTASGRVYPLSAEDSFLDQMKIFQNTGEFIDVDGQRASIIRCGKCIGCKTDKAKEWSDRLVMEASLYTENWFVTLTFDDDHYDMTNFVDNFKFDENGKLSSYDSWYGSVNVKHIQDFMKRLRKECKGQKIRYFACGEYGSKFERPHYHLILFNLHLPVDGLHYLKTTKQNNDLYTSDMISKCWKYGFNTCGSVTFQSCGYVARYTMKKVFGFQGKEFYENKHKKQPFLVMSRRPGIGHDFMINHDWTNEPNILVSDGEDSHMCPVPEYMERWIKKNDPFLAEERSKLKRRLAFEHMQVVNSQTDKTRSAYADTQEKVLTERTKVLTNRLDI